MTFSSCEIPYDDTGDAAAATSLLGEWQMTSLEFTGSATQTIAGLGTVNHTFEGEAYDINVTSTFTETPNRMLNEGVYSMHLIFHFVLDSSPPITINQDQTNIDDNLDYTWSIDGDQLTILPDGGIASTYTILELTDHSLKINGDIIMNFALPNGSGGVGATQDITVNQIVTYTR
jgi:hypothetical protein